MSTVPVRDLLSREYVGVNESDAVMGAAELMRNEGETVAVVLRGQSAVGVVTAEGILDYLLDGGDVETTPVSEVMTTDPPEVSPDSTIGEATRQLVGTGIGHVVVSDGTDVLGVLDARDIATANYQGHSRTRASDVPPGRSVDSRDAVDDGEFSNQSICEGCGSFAQDLVNVDGQLLCPDCRTV